MHKYKVENNWLNSSIAGKDLGIIVDHKLYMSQQCNTVPKKTNVIQRCINKKVIYKTQEVVILLYLALIRPQLEYQIQFWASHFKRYIENCGKSKVEQHKL